MTGHRGWIYSLTVSKNYRKLGIGTVFLKQADKSLIEKGCMKINLQILNHNAIVKEFWKRENIYKQEIV